MTSHRHRPTLPSFPTLFTVLILLIAVFGEAEKASASGGDAEAINNYLDGLPDWTPKENRAKSSKPSGLYQCPDDFGNTIACSCGTDEQTRTNTISKVSALAAEPGTIWPGAFLHGNALREGKTNLINLPRADATLTIDQAIESPSRVVEDIDSTSAQQAIADLQRAADARIGSLNIDVLHGMVKQNIVDVYSFGHALMSANLSLADSASIVDLKGDFTSDNKVKEHTVLGTLYQELFTIFIADDQYADSASFLGDSVTIGQVKRAIDSDERPVYIKSVSYGRMMIFTVKSREVTSTNELVTSVKAVYEGFKGGGGITDKQENTFKNATKNVVAFGGSQEDALAALNAADFGKFFTPLNATQAIPLNYTVKPIKSQNERSTLDVYSDEVVFYDAADCSVPVGVRVSVDLVSIQPTAGACRALHSFGAALWDPKADWMFSQIFYKNLRLTGKTQVQQTLKREFRPTDANNKPQFVVRSAYNYIPAIPQELAQAWFNKTQPGLVYNDVFYTYPFSNIPWIDSVDGKSSVPANPQTGCPADFHYVFRKEGIYN